MGLAVATTIYESVFLSEKVFPTETRIAKCRTLSDGVSYGLMLGTVNKIAGVLDIPESIRDFLTVTICCVMSAKDCNTYNNLACMLMFNLALDKLIIHHDLKHTIKVGLAAGYAAVDCHPTFYNDETQFLFFTRAAASMAASSTLHYITSPSL